MRIMNVSLLEEFAKSHPEAEQFIKCWHYEVQEKTWRGYQDVLESFPRAMIMQTGDVVSFELIAGDCYIFCTLHYIARILVIKGVGTLQQVLVLKNQPALSKEERYAYSSH